MLQITWEWSPEEAATLRTVAGERIFILGETIITVTEQKGTGI